MINRLPESKFSSTEFNALVTEALESLPDFFKEKLSNVEVVVTDWPTLAELRAAGAANRYSLLGLYQGIPLTRRTTGYGMVLPDKITIFRLPIERLCRTRQTVIAQVRRTVLHELAHHFGISDDRLRELGAY
ncbi:MAG: metallopeptidase family protein [Anaerolineae bacterium]